MQVALKPSAGKAGDLFELAGFLEKMRGSGHYLDLFVIYCQLVKCLLVHADDRVIVSTHDQKRGRANFIQVLTGQIRPAPA
jgi:hypothetical protein